MSLAARQELFAKFVADPKIERMVRRDPQQAAEQHGVPLAFAEWLALLPERRLLSFRRSRAHKDEVRAGKAPSRS